MLRAWLKLFRVVNLPTVPGDVLAGAASMSLAADCYSPALVEWAAGISVLIYMFGLVDNDLVGAKTDVGRPIPDGEIPLWAATLAYRLLPLLIIGLAFYAQMPEEWFSVAALLLVSIVLYNRNKSTLLMGACRGLNVGCGAAVVYATAGKLWLDWRLLLPFAVAGLFTLYIAAVTKYSEGEERDPSRKRRVGLLIGCHIYLQLSVLTVFAMLVPTTIPLLIAGCAMLIALRFLKRMLPDVSAS